jgi:osmotically-inducible protein OsmY
MNHDNESSETWINPEKLKLQKNFIDKSKEIGRSDNLYGRMDLDEQNPKRKVDSPSRSLTSSQVIEALKRSPEIDVSRVSVRIRGTHVTLEGEAENLKEVRAMLSIVKNLPGVDEVKNEMKTDDDETRH